MPFPLRFHPEADYDVLSATMWYEEQRLGLGEEFLDQLSSLLVRVANIPFQFPAIDGPVRRALLRRFPGNGIRCTSFRRARPPSRRGVRGHRGGRARVADRVLWRRR